jgi:GDP-4-dehydro-6-deoxy-D-mannose reductase
LTVLRPFNIVSHRLPPSSALGNMRRQLLAAAGRERSVRCGRLEIVRDFVPLASVVETVRRLLARPVSGQAIDVCSGVGIALGEILAAMAKRLDVDVRIVHDPDLVAMPAAPRVVGDPAALLAATGLAISPTPESLACLLLEDQPASKISP